jgi:hypothetical protein
VLLDYIIHLTFVMALKLEGGEFESHPAIGEFLFILFTLVIQANCPQIQWWLTLQ